MKRTFDYVTASMAAVSLASLVVLGGCGPENGDPVIGAQAKASAQAGAGAKPRQVKPSPTRGEVSHIETLTERPDGTGVGAVAGGVVGGVLGHQVGGGDGKKAATVVGAVGGALLGNKIERDRAVKVVGYQIEVRLETGDVRSFRQTQLDGLHVGSRVRVDGGALRPA